MSSPRSVLIVDGSEESREVFRAALRRGGAEVLEAARADEGLELARRQPFDLIVLDMETEAATEPEVACEFGKTAQASSTPIVVLGVARRQMNPLPTGEFVPKPYHYAPLIRRIEELLQSER